MPPKPGAGLVKVLRDQIEDLVGPDQGITKVVEGAGVLIGVGSGRHDPCATDGCRGTGEAFRGTSWGS